MSDEGVKGWTTIGESDYVMREGKGWITDLEIMVV